MTLTGLNRVLRSCLFLLALGLQAHFYGLAATASPWNDPVVVDKNGDNAPANLSSGLDAVGWLSSRCTISHIGDGLALTAGHCVLEEGESKTTKKSCDDLFVKWGYRSGQAKGTLNSQCVEIVSAEASDNLDYALLRIDPAPKSALKLGGRKQSAELSEISLLSHPLSEPLVWSGYCQIKSGSRKFGALMYERCYVDPGSSGAPILSAQDGSMIGIHNGEEFDGKKSYLYGTYVQDILNTLARN